MGNVKTYLKDIANEIRNKTVMTNDNQDSLNEWNPGEEKYQIKATEFAKHIKSIDRIRPMNFYEKFSNSKSIQNEVVEVAASYYDARKTGEDIFEYDSSDNPFSSDATVRNKENNKAKIDCSTYIGLVLRGIPYDASPYANKKVYTWNRSAGLDEIYENHKDKIASWSFKIIDKQPKYIFTDIGYTNCTSLKYAADFAEFFYKYSYVVFDRKMKAFLSDRQATIPNESILKEEELTSLKEIIQPGDLLFWSDRDPEEGKTPTLNQQKRFREVSHIGIVAEDINYFYEVSGKKIDSADNFYFTDNSDKEVEGQYPTVLKTKLSSDYRCIVMVCRPKYQHS